MKQLHQIKRAATTAFRLVLQRVGSAERLASALGLSSRHVYLLAAGRSGDRTYDVPVYLLPALREFGATADDIASVIGARDLGLVVSEAAQAEQTSSGLRSCMLRANSTLGQLGEVLDQALEDGTVSEAEERELDAITDRMQARLEGLRARVRAARQAGPVDVTRGGGR